MRSKTHQTVFSFMIRQRIFVVLSALLYVLSGCGEIGVIPSFTQNVGGFLILDPSAFSIPDYTSKNFIKIQVNAEKITIGSTLFFSLYNSCLNGEAKEIEDFTFTISEELLNTTFSLYARIKKNGLVSECLELKKVTHDNITPTFPSLQINSGALVTSSTKVNLTLSVEEASQMYITNDKTCKKEGAWEKYTTLKEWTLGQSNSEATVYVKFKDEADNETECVSASITHDGIAPTNPSLVINNGVASTLTTSVELTLTATNAFEVYVTNTPDCASDGTWTAFTTPATQNWTLGQTNTTATVYVKFRNSFLNESACVSDSIIHDNTPPTPISLSINSNASYTSSDSVTLTLAATGASQMYVTNNSNCEADGEWENFATSKNWTITTTITSHTVYAKFKDLLGNISDCTSDAIQFLPWTINSYLKSSNTGEADNFSIMALSSDGNTLAVGAQYEDSSATGINGNQSLNDLENSGAVYVFTRNGATWSQQAYIKASNTKNDNFFGTSVALSSDGNTLAVGAIGERSSATGVGGDQASVAADRAGAVYVFTRSGTIWDQQAYIKASNTEEYDNFGHAIALSSDGSTLAVGAPDEDSNAIGIGGDQGDDSASSSGAIYVFIRNTTSWTQQAYIKASNTAAGDYFGSSVTLSADGSTLAVGAQFKNSGGGIYSGAAYTFTRSGTTWSQQAYIRASNTADYDQFGASVTLSADGSTLAVAAPFQNTSGVYTGAVYIFTLNVTTWNQKSYIKASNAKHLDYFGKSIALSADGSILAVGAIDEDSNATGIGGDSSDNNAPSSGATYVFIRNGTTWGQQAYIKASNTEVGDNFGRSVALSSDGSTLVVGASGEDSTATGINGNQTSDAPGTSNSGAVYVYYHE